MPRTRDDARKLGRFLVAVSFLNVVFNLRFPSGEFRFWYLLPSSDVLMILGAFLLVTARGVRIPKLVHVFLAAFACFVRVLRFGDGIQEHYFAQRFSLYDVATFPEAVRFAHSALPWWKFYPVLAGAAALFLLLPFLAYHAFRAAEAYLADWRRAPFAGVLALAAFAVGLSVAHARAPQHHDHLVGGFATSVAPRLRREAKFLLSVHSDRGRWARAIARARERLERTPSNLAKLERKNVHLVLVESYGVVVVERPDFVKAVAPTFRAFEIELGELGYAMASGRVVAPTFGGRSWLAQATLATSIPITDQFGFDTVFAVKPPVLASFFHAAGYRTVLAAPGVTRKGTRGDLYRFDKTYYYADFEYAGPGFAWATMPDQFVLDSMRRRELERAGASPLFVQYVLVSSHAPWSETPTLVEDWSKLGNGALYDTQPVLRFPIVWPDLEHAHEAYVRSIVYDLEVIRRYIARYLNDDSLVIVLGDHQPVGEISGDERVKSVPVHVFSKNDAFVEPFRRRGYVPGMWPNGAAKPRGMDQFLPDLLRDFSTGASGPPH
jgi:hypothetical protein